MNIDKFYGHFHIVNGVYIWSKTAGLVLNAIEQMESNIDLGLVKIKDGGFSTTKLVELPFAINPEYSESFKDHFLKGVE